MYLVLPGEVKSRKRKLPSGSGTCTCTSRRGGQDADVPQKFAFTWTAVKQKEKNCLLWRRLFWGRLTSKSSRWGIAARQSAKTVGHFDTDRLGVKTEGVPSLALMLLFLHHEIFHLHLPNGYRWAHLSNPPMIPSLFGRKYRIILSSRKYSIHPSIAQKTTSPSSAAENFQLHNFNLLPHTYLRQIFDLKCLIPLQYDLHTSYW